MNFRYLPCASNETYKKKIHLVFETLGRQKSIISATQKKLIKTFFKSSIQIFELNRFKDSPSLLIGLNRAVDSSQLLLGLFVCRLFISCENNEDASWKLGCLNGKTMDVYRNLVFLICLIGKSLWIVEKRETRRGFQYKIVVQETIVLNEINAWYNHSAHYKKSANKKWMNEAINVMVAIFQIQLCMTSSFLTFTIGVITWSVSQDLLHFQSHWIPFHRQWLHVSIRFPPDWNVVSGFPYALVLHNSSKVFLISLGCTKHNESLISKFTFYA